MGHKVHPRIHRLQIIDTWDSRWFAKKNYAAFAAEDIRIREFLLKRFKDAHIDTVGIERGPKQMTVTIIAAKPGFIIGRGGAELEVVRKELERRFLQMKRKVKLNIQELHSPALSAAVIAQTMVSEIERRIPFRRVMKQTIERVMKSGARGIKVRMAGRLNGVEIARRETLSAGSVPLITFRSGVEYSYQPAFTIYGKIGIKVWIYHGEVFGRLDKLATANTEAEKKKVSK
ncbi:MAG: 30S ribosomal protein S3 [Candidatus Magasanikbacteria bacterium]|nr:30S ribosomal protein S3 [Candidatus Magasanikbacteria bacterium]